jgi:hypothetical protein
MTISRDLSTNVAVGREKSSKNKDPAGASATNVALSGTAAAKAVEKAETKEERAGNRGTMRRTISLLASKSHCHPMTVRWRPRALIVEPLDWSGWTACAAPLGL